MQAELSIRCTAEDCYDVVLIEQGLTFDLGQKTRTQLEAHMVTRNVKDDHKIISLRPGGAPVSVHYETWL